MLADAGFKSVGIVGIGLIGGSFAKAFAAGGLKTYGYDSRGETLAAAADSGIFEGVTDELEPFLGFAPDLVYICLPVNAAVDFIRALKKAKWRGAVTDSASTKISVMEAARGAAFEFCGGHPIRGKESSGFINSEAGLFENARHILTPAAAGNLPERLKILHESIGMEVLCMDAAVHDTMLAYVSHFPHMAAFCLMDMVDKNSPEAFGFVGGGFKDFTRIAASDPVMWADIFIDNADKLLDGIDKFSAALRGWRGLIEKGDKSVLREKILRISELRRNL